MSGGQLQLLGAVITGVGIAVGGIVAGWGTYVNYREAKAASPSPNQKTPPSVTFNIDSHDIDLSDRRQYGGSGRHANPPATPRPAPPPLQALPVHKTTPWPSMRSGAAAAYDPDRNTLVVVGGSTDRGPLSEVAEWNADERKWRIRPYAGDQDAVDFLKSSGPKALVYDASRKSLNLFTIKGDAGPVQRLAVLQWTSTTGRWSFSSRPTENAPLIPRIACVESYAGRLSQDSPRSATINTAGPWD